MKRLFDITFACVGLLFFGWLIGLLVVLVRLETPGPGIFAQRRLGMHEVPFTCYKIRTMGADTKSAPSHEVSASAVTRLGRFLRAKKLDELPQLWNILVGDMSFVGPRPGLPGHKQLTEARRRNGVYSLRPGITGVAQVQGVDMSDPEKLARLDATYLEGAGLRLDIALILKTLTGAGQGDKVRNDGGGA